ncbi:hypothetical protein EVAR_34538_1 [Eumeta japonica]|uniref:Uncharacterized protein n=1 Tax=Eumeta variegata TaxID=151549 RepID=A0A4C1X474_EUMVA|nr:hypothetical protein EVAR_34538_1 [Eumeta japonica]
MTRRRCQKCESILDAASGNSSGASAPPTDGWAPVKSRGARCFSKRPLRRLQKPLRAGQFRFAELHLWISPAPLVHYHRTAASARAHGHGKYNIRESDGGSTQGSAKNNVPIDTATEDITVLLSVISTIDIDEIVLVAKKFKAAANPVEKNILLAENAQHVEAIKNNKI